MACQFVSLPSHIIGDNKAETWADYFQCLATTQDLLEYDKEHKTSMAFRTILIMTYLHFQ